MGKKKTYILQHLDLTRQNPHLLLILTLQLIQHRRRVLAPRIRRRTPEHGVFPCSPVTTPTTTTTTTTYTIPPSTITTAPPGKQIPITTTTTPIARTRIRAESSAGMRRHRRCVSVPTNATVIRRCARLVLGLGGRGAAVVRGEEVVARVLAAETAGHCGLEGERAGGRSFSLSLFLLQSFFQEALFA